MGNGPGPGAADGGGGPRSKSCFRETFPLQLCSRDQGSRSAAFLWVRSFGVLCLGCGRGADGSWAAGGSDWASAQLQSTAKLVPGSGFASTRTPAPSLQHSSCSPLQARLAALADQWQFLVQKSAEKSQKLKEANKQQNFNTGIKDFDFWLSEVAGMGIVYLQDSGVLDSLCWCWILWSTIQPPLPKSRFALNKSLF